MAGATAIRDMPARLSSVELRSNGFNWDRFTGHSILMIASPFAVTTMLKALTPRLRQESGAVRFCYAVDTVNEESGS